MPPMFYSLVSKERLVWLQDVLICRQTTAAFYPLVLSLLSNLLPAKTSCRLVMGFLHKPAIHCAVLVVSRAGCSQVYSGNLLLLC